MKTIKYYDKCINTPGIICYTCLCVTFLSHRAPDGDDEHADDGENQKRQNATYHSIWYCAMSLHNCTWI